MADLSDFTVKDAGTLRMEASGMTVKSVSVESGAILGLPADGGTTTVTGALTLTGSPAFRVKPDFGGPPVQGSFNLLSPGSVAGTAGLITTDLGSYQDTRTYGGVTTITGGKLVLNVTVGSPAAGLVWSNGSGDLVVSFERVDAAEAYQVTVGHGTNLQSWTSIPVPTAAVTGPPVTVLDNGTDPDAITAVVPGAGDSRKFARVSIAIPANP